jgi:hypothetical protein
MGNDCNHDCENCSDNPVTFEDLLHKLCNVAFDQGVSPDEVLIELASTLVQTYHASKGHITVAEQDHGFNLLMDGMRAHLAGLQSEAQEGPKQ